MTISGLSIELLLILTQPTVNSRSPYQECGTLALSILRNSGPPFSSSSSSPPMLLHCHPALIPHTNLSLCSEGQICWSRSVRGTVAYDTINGHTKLQHLQVIIQHTGLSVDRHHSSLLFSLSEAWCGKSKHVAGISSAEKTNDEKRKT